MRAVNVKELKARLSWYVREAGAGEVFLVTDRSRVVARLGPPAEVAAPAVANDLLARLLVTGTRPPLRPRSPADYRRSGPGSGLPATRIDALLDEIRSDSESS
jgi:antitoxin (DNA-binding transcriptional repressor) of toxin-antitoxin stability system